MRFTSPPAPLSSFLGEEKPVNTHDPVPLSPGQGIAAFLRDRFMGKPFLASEKLAESVRNHLPVPLSPRLRGGKGLGDRGVAFLFALLIPAFVIQVALAYPIEEHGFDVAAFHIFRGVVFSDARAQGVLVPRWVMPINAGMGGPMFSFYSPLVYYGMDALHDLGLPHTLGWRVLIAGTVLLGAIGMYLLGLALFRRTDAALVATACFIYAPYLLRDLFERGSPEGMAVVLYPWVLWALLRLAQRPSGLRLAIAVLCWAAVIVMHNLTALLFVPVLGLFCIFLAQRYGIKALAVPIAALALGGMLAAFHALPFVFDSKNIALNNSSNEVSLQPVSYPIALGDLLGPPPIFDTGIDNNSTGFSLGWLHWLALATGAIAAIFAVCNRKTEAILLIGLLAWASLMIFMETVTATPIWAALPFLAVLQFRVRLLPVVGLIAAIGIGYALVYWPERWTRWRWVAVGSLIVAFIGLQLPSLYPNLLHRYNAFSPAPTVADMQSWATANHLPGMTLTTVGELLPRWRTARFTDDELARVQASPVDNLPAGAKVLDSQQHAESWQLHLDSPIAFRAALHLMYFPGWAGTVNNQPVTLQAADSTGYMLVDVPAGTSVVALQYDGTPAMNAGDALSLAALLIVIGASVLWRRRNSRYPAPDAKNGVPTVYIYPYIPRWLLVGAIAFLAVKEAWIDPQTTLLRYASTCDAIQGATAQTGVSFGDNVHLCGYTLDGTTVHRGETLHITLYWQINQPIGNLNSYVHLLGQAFNPVTNNPLWGQQDKQSPGGLATSQWLPGKLYQDSYDFAVDPNAPPGTYQLEIGWTNANGERLQPTLSSGPAALSISGLKSLLISGIAVQ